MRDISKIIIHCSATKEGLEVCAADIDKWHKERGWDCIGYHYVIKLDGSIEEGRPLEQVGAHCKGHNKESIGICYIGGLDKMGRAKDTRTKEQKRALKELCQELLDKFKDARVYGHRDFEPHKDCPCFDVRSWYGSDH